QSIEAFYAHVPGLKVICVASPYDAKGLLKSAIRDPNPVIFLEHKKAYRAFRQDIPDEDYTIPIGQAETKREGTDISLITYGMMTHHSLKAAETVDQENGASVEVIDLRTVSPWDKERVLESVKKTGKALIVYEDNITGGFGAEVAAKIAQEGATIPVGAELARLETAAGEVPADISPVPTDEEASAAPAAQKAAAAAPAAERQQAPAREPSSGDGRDGPGDRPRATPRVR